MGEKLKEPSIIIAGLGNVLMRDDGAGVHVIREIMHHPIAGTKAVEIGCAVFDSLHELEQAERILFVDAMEGGGSPGSVYLCDLSEIDNKPIKGSLHHLSVINAMEIFLQSKASTVKLIGIEPEIIDYGLELSGSVLGAIPRVCEIARMIASEWTNGTSS
jgi:hydrogenase maturation protease